MHRYRILATLTTLFLLVTGCSQSTALKTDQINESQEILIAKAPDGWQNIYQLNNTITRLSDYIPPESSKSDWSTKISFESHQQLSDIDPITILMGEIEKTSEICSHTSNFNLFSGLENGYPTSVRLIFCGENVHSNKGEVSLTKAIQGKDYFYIIRFLKRVPKFSEDSNPAFSEAEIATWSAYLGEIKVCDNSAPGQTCDALAKSELP